MLAAHLLLALAWTIYYILHSLLAHLPVKQWFHARMGKSFRLYRLAYSLVALILLLPPLYLLISIPSIRFWLFNPWIGTLAGLTVVTGLTGILICLKKYIGSPGGFRDLFFEGVKPPLQVRGLHRYVRHPLYLSTFIFAGGVLLFFPYLSVLMSYLLMVAYVLLAIPLEEKKLIGMYGEEYVKYRKQVGALVPRAGSSKQGAVSREQ